MYKTINYKINYKTIMILFKKLQVQAFDIKRIILFRK